MTDNIFRFPKQTRPCHDCGCETPVDAGIWDVNDIAYGGDLCERCVTRSELEFRIYGIVNMISAEKEDYGVTYQDPYLARVLFGVLERFTGEPDDRDILLGVVAMLRQRCEEQTDSALRKCGGQP